MSIDKRKHVHLHTLAPTDTRRTRLSSRPTLFFRHPQLKTGNEDWRRRKTAAWNGKHGRPIVSEKKCLEV